MKRLLSFLTILVCVTAAGKQPKITSRPFGELSTGESTTLYTITNRSGASMQLLDYGARIVSIMMPDRKGHNGDVVVGFGDIENFEKKDRFIGPVIGAHTGCGTLGLFFVGTER